MDRTSYLSLGRWAGLALFLLSTGLCVGRVSFGLPLPSPLASYGIAALGGALAGVVFGIGMEKRLLKPDMETFAPFFVLGALYGLMVPIAFASVALMQSVDPASPEPLSLWLLFAPIVAAMVPFVALTAWLSYRIRRLFQASTWAYWRQEALEQLSETLDRCGVDPTEKQNLMDSAGRSNACSAPSNLLTASKPFKRQPPLRGRFFLWARLGARPVFCGPGSGGPRCPTFGTAGTARRASGSSTRTIGTDRRGRFWLFGRGGCAARSARR